MSILKAVVTVGSYTGLSRIFGLVREILMSHFLGAGMVTDAFFVAFRFPNFFRRFFGEGAFNAAFVPLFASEMVEHGREHAKKIANDVFSCMAFFLTIFSITIILATPYIIHILAPGFATTPERLELATNFIRITFPYILFMSLTALISGILNSLNKFASAAAAPIILNLVMIASLLLSHYYGWDQGYSLCISVFIAGILQFAGVYYASSKQGFALTLKKPTLSPAVRKLLKVMGPSALGAGVMQINIFIDSVLASFLPTGAVSYLYYADRLNQLPLSIFGIAISTALLPLLAKQLQRGEDHQALRTTTQSIEASLLLTLPSTVGLIMMAVPIIDLIYGHGKFDTLAIAQTAPTLAAFAVGLPAYVVGKVLSTCFFARQDTKTPLKIASITIFINLALNLTLIGPLQHIGLALSTAIAAWVNTALLAYVMHRKGWYTVMNKELFYVCVKICAATFIMGALLFALDFIIEKPTSTFEEIVNVMTRITAGGAPFLVATHVLGISTFFKLIFKKRANKS